MSILNPYYKRFNSEQFQSRLEQVCRQEIDIARWGRLRGLLAEFEIPACRSNISEKIQIEFETEPAQEWYQRLELILKQLIPWRTGPYSIGTTEIDSEWRSNLKWERVENFFRDVRGKRVADIGCSSGYHCFQLAQLEPALVLGFDPNPICYQQSCFLQRFLSRDNLEFVPLGVDALEVFSGFFHSILCMGVIYHRRDPFGMLKTIKDSLLEGGRLVIESITDPREIDMVLTPRDRYMKMRNTWFVPTTQALCGWLERVGFKEIEVVSVVEHSTDEQRQTELAPYESLKDFISEGDPGLTVEGYPMPTRSIVSCIR